MAWWARKEGVKKRGDLGKLSAVKQEPAEGPPHVAHDTVPGAVRRSLPGRVHGPVVPDVRGAGHGLGDVPRRPDAAPGVPLPRPGGRPARLPRASRAGPVLQLLRAVRVDPGRG